MANLFSQFNDGIDIADQLLWTMAKSPENITLDDIVDANKKLSSDTDDSSNNGGLDIVGIIILIILWSSQFGVKELAEAIFNVDITPK